MTTKRDRKKWLRTKSRASAAILCLAAPALAGPHGEHVVRGNVNITRDGSTTLIQASNKAIIDFNTFDIGAGETVRFLQPSANSRVLNRVTGGQFSRIDGTLTANGRVIIANPAGVYFSGGAVVDVGGIYAAAGNITNRDFLNGANHFTDIRGDVVNDGTIRGDSVNLIGRFVANHGSIVATGGAGVVTMVAGSDVFVSEQGGSVLVKVAPPTQNAAAPAPGHTSMVAGDIYSLAIQHTGTTTAKNIQLNGGKSGVVEVSGKLDASASAAGEKGGHVSVLGDQVALRSATIDASGSAGGGTVLVGGDFHGQGGTPTASRTYVSADSTIRADAIVSGDGGKVVVWSDQWTGFYGTISARGATTADQGGNAEVSSKLDLAFNPKAVNLGGGELLLDPLTITIQDANPDINGNGATGDDIAASTDLDNAAADFAGADSIITSTALNAVLVGSSVTLAATNSISVSTSATPISIANGKTLTLNAPTVNLGDAIGGAGTLDGGATVTTVNVSVGASINNGVSLLPNSGGTLNIDPGTYSEAVSIGAPITSLTLANTSGTVSAVTANSWTVNSAVTTKGTFAASSGGVTFNQTVTLGANTVISAGANPIAFNSTVDGPHTLTANSTGATTFAADVGGIDPLTSLTTNGGGTASLQNVTTTGSQTYSDATVTLNGTYTTTNSSFTIANAALLGADTTVSTGNGAISFDGAVNGAHSLEADTTGTTAFGSTVGGVTPLSSLATDAVGTTTLAGNVSTSGDQSFGDALVINSGSNLITLSGDDVTLASTVRSATDGQDALTVTASGVTTFSGAVGDGGKRLAALTVDGGDATLINGGAITTTGTQTYADPITLGADAALTGGSLVFNNTVDAAGHNLTINTSGATVLDGTSFNSLADFAVQGGGTTQISGTVSSSGGQTFDVPVTLADDATVVSTGGGDIAFNSTVNGAHALDVNTAGTTSFNGVVGGITPLTSLTTDAPGATSLGTTITTTGNQTFNDPVALSANTTIHAAGVNFVQALDSSAGAARDLTLDVSGATTFTGAVGGTHRLGNLVTDTPGTTHIDGGSVATSGDQTYNDPVILGDDTTITAVNATFGQTLNATSSGGQDLILDVSGTTRFSGEVGGAEPLGDLQTDAPGTTAINGGAVTTTGDQVYGDAVTIGADTTLTGNTFDFRSTIESPGTPFALSIVTDQAGGVSFGGAVGGNGNPLASLTVSQGQLARAIGGTIESVGDQIFNQPVVLIDDAVLTSQHGSIVFNSTLDATSNNGSAEKLTLNAAEGEVRFNGVVGGTLPLGQLTVAQAASVTVAAPLTIGGDLSLQASGLMEFAGDGDLVIQARSITLNGLGRDVPTTKSDIFKRTQGDLSFISTAGGFTMGANEKLTVADGSLSIQLRTQGTVRVGDLSALNNISITSEVKGSTLEVITRDPAPIDTLGDAKSPDVGTDFVAGNKITLKSVKLTAVDPDPDPQPPPRTANPKPQFATTTGGQTLGKGFTVRQYGPGIKHDISSDDNNTPNDPGDDTVFDLEVRGPSNTVISEALAGAVPPLDVPKLSSDTSLSAAQRDRLRDMGIYARYLTFDELLERIGGAATYNDIPVGAVGGILSQYDRHQIAVTRVSAERVTAVLALYERIYLKRAGGTDAQPKYAADADKIAHVKTVLGDAAKRFIEQSGNQKIDPLAFRVFIDSPDSNQAEAKAIVRDLGQLLREVKLLGLTPVEYTIARRVMLRDITPAAMSPDEFGRTIEAVEPMPVAIR